MHMHIQMTAIYQSSIINQRRQVENDIEMSVKSTKFTIIQRKLYLTTKMKIKI